MIICKDEKSIKNQLKLIDLGSEIGFVPTMGAIHKGHISLIEKAKAENSLVVSSLFVNPTQFNDQNDFLNYPKTIENDIFLLEKAGCDILFLPSVKVMYPEGLTNLETINYGYLDTVLEGKYRPGHFQGVGTIVYRLLSLISPQKLYLGKKDYQQCLIIKEMILLKNLKVSTILCETIREDNGLAISSRNVRLSEQSRQKASAIYQMMQYCKASLITGKIEPQLDFPIQQLQQIGFKIDYFEVVNVNTLKTIINWDGKEPIMVIVAVFLDGVRLIDNLLM
jgi:pantoate--beta-alanine ligase